MREIPCNLWTMISDQDSLSTNSTQEAENDSVDELKGYSRIDDIMRLLISAKWEARRYTSHVAQKPDEHLISYVPHETKDTINEARASYRVSLPYIQIFPCRSSATFIRNKDFVTCMHDISLAHYAGEICVVLCVTIGLFLRWPEQFLLRCHMSEASFGQMFSFIKAWSKAYGNSDRLTPLAYIKLKNKLEKWFKMPNLKRRVLRKTQIVYNPGVTDIAPENRLKFKRIWQRIQKEYGVERLILNNIINQSKLTKRMEEKQKAQFQSVAKTLAAKERQRILSIKQSGFISHKELQISLDYLKNKIRPSGTETSVSKPEIIRRSENIPFVETSNPEKFSLEPLRQFMVRRLKELITTSPEIKENIPETFFHDSLSTNVFRLSEEFSDSHTHEQLDWLKTTSHSRDEEFTDMDSELFQPFRHSTETSSTGTFRAEPIGIFDEDNPERYTMMQLFKAAESILKPRNAQQ
ncbi:hypothetical protein CRM22_007889 [Opisthorchis felineus]|uniref:Uncharacterized protein n=2 Tax=Opisthorchis felineus TaxID=147828 RepID=A0A4S2LE39_OPIFE|nr:hypothetical protein CRM22_007889 [Opisthorchis felineus]